MARTRTKMDREWLYEQYVILGRSSTDISEDLNKDPSTIAYWLRKLKIPRRVVGSMSQERIERNRVEVVCLYCGSKFLKSPARANRCKRHFCTHECSEKWSVGEHHVLYKGLKVDQTGRASFEYRQWRIAVFKRDNYTCQQCGSKRKIHSHHLKSYAEHENLRVDVSNGITLCSKCHFELHGKMKRWSKYLKDVKTSRY